MKTIEVATAHNIVFKYDLAGALSRCLATLIDLMIIAVYASFGSGIFGWNTFLNYTFIFLPIMLYHLLFEVFNRGQSPGKMLMKLRVVTLRGTTPTLNDFFIRWIFRMVDITFSVGTLALLNINGSEKKQRIGDLIAQTTVISLKSSTVVSLKSLEALNNTEEELKYPKLKNFTDEDMLLLKHAILRYTEFKTDENRLILRKIGQKIMRELGLKESGDISLQFLKDILNEYVILTR